MATRKNFGVRLGRPTSPAANRMPAPPKMTAELLSGPMGASPMDSFAPGIPAAAFKRGGGVGGYSTMPKHHDDPAFCSGGKVK